MSGIIGKNWNVKKHNGWSITDTNLYTIANAVIAIAI